MGSPATNLSATLTTLEFLDFLPASAELSYVSIAGLVLDATAEFCLLFAIDAVNQNRNSGDFGVAFQLLPQSFSDAD